MAIFYEGLALEGVLIMRWLKRKNSSGKIHDTSFFASIDLYQETGFFIFLADAFLTCHNKGYEIPENLEEAIAKHFRKFVDAKDRQEGLSGLGFDNNKDGGAWQGKAARAKTRQAEILGLLNDLLVFDKKSRKDELFIIVAKIAETTPGRVKKLYYETLKNKPGRLASGLPIKSYHNPSRFRNS